MYQAGFTVTGIILCLINRISSQAAEYGLYPVVFNLATNARITSNATCGAEKPEAYCRLVEHVARQYARGDTHCSVCDLHSANSHERYPITNAIDGSTSWWQSPTIASGYQYHYVTIKVDLQQIYQIAYVIVKAANSPRPGNWILERSIDGTHFKPWMFFAQSDSECWNQYNIPPTVGIPRYKRDDDVICSSYFSRIDPLYGGEIHISLVNGRPGVDGPSQELIDFTMARYIRLRFQKIRTLNADLMTFMSNDISNIDPTVTNRYFYSIKDISVGGQCICYGHARLCPSDPLTGEMKCDCEGNTCGNSCERCCPLFNQQPWRAGSFKEAAFCEECECYGHAEACEYNATVAEMETSSNTKGQYSGGGVCLDCKHNTMGINCEICVDGFYRPNGIDPRSEYSCVMCLCDGPGAIGVCVKDNSRAFENIFAGDCICKEGYCGPRCEQCSPGYRGYPNCVPCECNRAGSANLDTCEDNCICKEHVAGESCDRCAPGFFNLQQEKMEGCDACFCFGITDTCRTSSWGRTQISSLTGWNVTDMVGSGSITPRRGRSGVLYVNKTDIIDSLNTATYWEASTQYTGDRVMSYGGALTYTFSYAMNDSNTKEIACKAFFDPETDNYLYHPDVIIEGSGLRLGHSGVYFDECTQHSVEIHMNELGWQHLNGSLGNPGMPVSREEMMLVLGNVERLLVRASYHIHQTSITLFKVSLDTASRGGGQEVMSQVEMCNCPEGYAGSSCQTCAVGYRRVGDILLSGICEPCQCYNHSLTCDDFTAECYHCQHNTRGPFCEDCAFGYFGNAMIGTADACKPCGCPLPNAGNYFAEGCITTLDEEEQYMCVGCADGYDGRFCEICSPGYYGDPNVPGGSCQPCRCNGNTDPSQADYCNRFTGECFSCSGNTEGFNCEVCQSGYYGSAVNGDCTTCGCDGTGATSQICDRTTGQCDCKNRYISRDCSLCQEGYGYFTQGCLSCDCDPVGSMSWSCDLVTGQCLCKTGVTGTRCNRCIANYWGFANDGCLACDCDTYGSESMACDRVTGQCVCKAHVIGAQCDECETGYWGVESGRGCEACKCDPVGSESLQCDVGTGECMCRRGIEGPTCQQCLVGFYGFSRYGCKKCRECPLPGQVCDPEDGDCVCPPNTDGLECDACVLNHWGYDPYRGCKPCGCSPIGSTSQQCDLYTGQCLCHHGYSGTMCDDCPSTFYGFPFCFPCECNMAGSVPDNCDTGLGDCSCEPDGVCSCKRSVEGAKCDTCMEASFSLQAENPSGCTSCFCSGHSQTCSQALYVWSSVSIPDQQASVSLSEGSDVMPSSHGYLVMPPHTSSYEVLPVHSSLPLYWRLPEKMLNDQTLSYNGHLKFKMAAEFTNSGPSSSSQPLIHLVGNYRLNLLYYLPTEPVERTAVQEYDVLLREDLWRDESGQPVDRVTLMVALHKVQHFLIRTAHSAASVRNVRLYDMSYNMAVPAEEGEIVDAYGIEECVCPPQYVGLSCQDPAAGYYREHPDDYLERDDPMSLIGESVSCECYNHAQDCHKETGLCIDCQHNTEGNYCGFCMNGYYGDATMATPYDCTPCACPLTIASNNFSPTCVLQVSGDEFYCNACLEGYGGNKCQRCAAGYYGNPALPGGSCEPCLCNPEGASSDRCDSVTGQCDCYAGIVGRACDECAPRHAIVDGHCESCLEGCAGILFQDLDHVEVQLSGFNSSAQALLPWARISNMESDIEELTNALGGSNMSAYSMLHEEVQWLGYESSRIQRKATRKLDSVDSAQGSIDVKQQSADLARDITNTKDEVELFIQEIQESVADRIANNSGGYDLDNALAAAERILRDARRTDFFMIQQKIVMETREAEDLLDRTHHLHERHDVNLEAEVNRSQIILEKIQELNNKLTDTSQNISAIKSQNEATQIALDELKDTLVVIQSRLRYIEACTVNETASNELASHLLWNESSQFYKDSMVAVMSIRAGLMQMEHIVGLLHQNIPVSEDRVNQALAHAKQLTVHSTALQEQFESTKLAAENPLRAADVYQNMKDAVLEADRAVKSATEAATNASSAISNSEQGTLPDQTKESLNSSKNMLEGARSVNTSTQALSEKDTSMKQEHAGQSGTLVEGQEGVVDVTVALDGLNTDVATQARRVLNITNSTQSLIQEVIAPALIAGQLKRIWEIEPKMQDLTSLSVANLLRANQSVNTARDKFDELTNLTEEVEKKKEAVEHVGFSVAQGLLELRQKIKVARAQANSIKISLSHESSCVRKYTPPSQPSMSNSLTLFFKTNNTAENMALFLINNPQSNVSDYLGVEMVGGFVRLSFDVGAGTTSVEHDLEIIPARGRKEEQKWYMVKVERIANVAKLSVKEAADRSPALEIIATAPNTYTQLYVDKNTHFFIGGVSPNYKLPGDLTGHGFSGCMGHVTFDGRDMGLFNFQELEGSGCSGCKVVPLSPPTNGLVHLDGTGYVEMPQIRYRRESYTILLKFKGFWDEALLFFAANDDNGDFISLELRQGRVVYRFGTDAQSLLTLSTEARYNTNQWVSVRAMRQGRHGMMDVDGEIVSGASSLNSPEALYLDGVKLYIGGVPATYETHRYGVTRVSFLGCLKDVQLVSKSTSVQDLSQYTFVGLQPGCGTRPFKEVGLTGDGFIELPSPDLPRDGGLAFSFRSVQSDALLLLAQGLKRDNFYSVSLSAGRVSAWFSAGSGVVRITTDNTYNDGNIHSVSINKVNRFISMQIDDKMVGYTRLPPGAARINSMRGPAGGLYIGGLPLDLPVEGAAASYNNFQGCIIDLISNGELLVFDNPVNFDRADIGRCDISKILPNITDTNLPPTPPSSFTVSVPMPTSTMTTTPPSTTTTLGPTVHPGSCAEEGLYQFVRGVAFGDLKGSHAEVVLTNDDFVPRFNISMELRTYHGKGVIFYLANLPQTDFLAVELRNGTIHVVFSEGQGISEINSRKNVTSGEWISLKVHQANGVIQLKVAKEMTLTAQISRTVNVNNTMFVGGFPLTYSPRREVIKESFKGCIRDFALDRLPTDLTSSKTVMGVRRCYRDTERGIHFDGFGYAVYESNFIVGSNFKVEFDFRTIEEEGVLLSTSTPSGDKAMSLELYDGVLHFRVINNGQTFEATAGECRHCLCDNTWHSVRAEYTENVITVQVDRSPVGRGQGSLSDTTLDTNTRLYIGGFPPYETRGSLLSGSVHFHGCLRGLIVNDIPTNWHDMYELTDVHVSACPHYESALQANLQ